VDRNKVFNKVAMHLLKQGVQSISNHGGCMYRTKRGDKNLSCAVGCVIPDTAYSYGMEGVGLSSVLDTTYGGSKPSDHRLWKAIEAGVGPCSMEDITLLHEMQKIHDGRTIMFCKNYAESWAISLRLLADKEKIKLSPAVTRKIAGITAARTKRIAKETCLK
jgi:hypothetical protein